MKIVPVVVATVFAAVISFSPLLVPSAAAQSAAGSQMNAPTHPGPNQWARDRDWYTRPGWQQGGPAYGWMGPWMMGPHARSMMGGRPGWAGRHASWRHWHRYTSGAHFSFSRGNARIDIQCPANQSLKDCVDAASTLIDKVAGMGPHAPPAPPPPGKPKPPAGPKGSGPMQGGKSGGDMPNTPSNKP
jgi:hypothetical protein